jgi:hypothetical protein
VPVRIGYVEKALIDYVKTAKDRWNPDRRLRLEHYEKIKGTALEKHEVLNARLKQPNYWFY